MTWLVGIKSDNVYVDLMERSLQTCNDSNNEGLGPVYKEQDRKLIQETK